MDRYFKKLSSVDSSSDDEPPLLQPQELSNEDKNKVDLENLPSDPGKRPDIMSYPPNLIEQVRRAYLLKGPCQPLNHDFRPTVDGNLKRKFVSHWFDEFKDWLEYSTTKEATFCLYCYLFSRLHGKGQDAFVSGGFTVWHKKERLRDHVGDHKSAHNRCRLACEGFMNQAQHIEVSLAKQSTQSKLDYRLRLNATIVFLRYLVMQGLPFRGHDESEESLNQDNFLEFLKVSSSCNEEIASVVLKYAPDNLKLTSPDIQKDFINAAAIWEVLLTDVSRFCSKYELVMLDMEDEFEARKKGRRRTEKIKNLHYYRVELFLSVIDLQAQELNQCFDEVSTDLVLCMSCFDPRDSFSAFDSEKLLRLARYYHSEFSEVALSELESQLDFRCAHR